MRSNIKKFKICAVCLSLLFALTTAIGLLALPLRGAFAADGRAAAITGELKFKQLAVGEDFAIALSYDNDLYAWSLLDTPAKQSELNGTISSSSVGDVVTTDVTTSAKTLGEFYPKNPIKLDVRLTGVNYKSGEIISGVGHRATYEYIGDNDKIKQIAATRKTAAFLTEKGLVYTWGDMHYEPRTDTSNGTTDDLLLRPIVKGDKAPTEYPAINNKYIPSIINYGGSYDGKQLSAILPNGSATNLGHASKEEVDIADFELSASEYNYLLYYKRFESSTATYANFVWGQNAYGQRYNGTGTGAYNLNKSTSDFIIGDKTQAITSQAYLGDGNIYYFDGDDKLYVRGKNYVVTDSEVLKTNGTNMKLNGIVNTLFASGGHDGYTMLKKGGTFSPNFDNADIESIAVEKVTYNYVKIPNAVTQFKQLDSSNFVLHKRHEATLRDSNGGERAKIKLSQFSAANGYGYAINSSGNLMFWGDNRLGQGKSASGTALENIDSATGYTQVVAGKVISGDSIIEAINEVIADSAKSGNDNKWKEDTAETGDNKYTKLKDDFVDGNTLISATLSLSGISVFGAYEGDKFDSTIVNDKLKEKGVGLANSTNQVAALFGGYGNNLFVLSTLGKIYRIRFNETAIQTAKTGGTYSVANIADYLICEPYDKFYVTTYNSGGTENTGSSEITNWATGNEASKIAFDKGYLDSNGNSTVSAVVGLDVDGGATLNATNTLIKGQTIDGEALGEDNAGLVTVSPKYAVTNNNSGDAYRMILPLAQHSAVGNADDLNVATGLKDIDASYKGLMSTPEKVNGWNLEFYWKEGTKTYSEPIPQDVAFRYFKIDYRYNSDRVEFVLTPKRSTMGKSIVIKYWVGRYDADSNANLVNSNDASPEFRFYDFKQASLEIEIADTQFVKNYTLRTDNDDQNSNSSVPLLDPNNPFNKNYSIAAMNVSKGFDKLIEALAKELNVTDPNIIGDDSNQGSVKTELLKLVEEQDAGFPALSKVTDGSLDYYGVSSYYNNIYRFFASDHDGDLIEFDNIGTTDTVYKDYFDFELNDVPVLLPLNKFGSSLSINENNLKNLFEKTEANGRVSRFDNKYGLELSIVKTVSGTGESATTEYGIKIVYSVLTITAKKSMPSTYISYFNEADNKYNISAPKTFIDEARNTMNLLRPCMGQKTADGSSFVYTDIFENSDGGLNGVAVFTQSSLTFKERNSSNVGTIYNEIGAHEIYGSKSGKNEYTMKTIPLALGVVNTGIGGGQYRIYLGDFFDDYENLRFSYKGDPEALNDLKATFGPGLNAIEITDIGEETGRGQYIEIKPYRKVTNAQFTFEVRRIVSGNITFSDMNETAYITFSVTATFNETDLFSKQDVGSEYSINGYEEIEITSRMRTSPEFLTREGMCTVDVESNNEAVVTVKRSSDRLKFELTGKTSGTALVSYKVKLFGRNEYVFEDSFEVKVTTQAAMDVPYQVIDRTKIYFSELENYVKRVNGIDVSLSLKEDKPFRTEQTDGDASLPDSELEWYEADIKFLKTPEIDNTKQFLLLAIGDFDSSDTPPTSRVVVTFVDKDGREYDVAFRVSPAAMNVKDKLAGKTFTFDINKANGTIAVYGRESGNGVEEAKKLYAEPYENGMFSIGVEFFNSVMEWPETKNNVIVAAQTNGNKYIEVTTSSPENATAILITPLYPTTEDLVDGCIVQVSLRDTDDQTVTLLSFYVRVSGIKTVLEKEEYRNVILAVFFSVLGLLVIIFFIRMGVYWKKKADQRKIIKKNQTLIKMREKMHNKTEAVNKRNIVRTKLKMEDPKYARMFDEMRREKEAQSGIALDNSLVAQKVDKKVKAEKAAKKKKKKGSLDELQAQIAAKRDAMERMQAGDFSAMPEGMATVVDIPPMDGVAVEQPVPEVPVFNTADLDSMTAEQLDEQLRATLGDDPIIFEAVEPDQNGENQ